MTITRRQFVGATSLGAVATVLPGSLARAADLHGHRGSPWVYVPRHRGLSVEPDLHALAARAVDAARSAGADYADARLTLTRHQIPGDSEGEDRGFGVRVLVNGYWGFLASAVWTPDEAARLARAAVVQANAHRRGKSRPVALGTIPVVTGGEWVMPVKYDPFDIPMEEKLDVMASFRAIASAARVGIGTQAAMQFVREHRIFASSDGSSWAQTTYRSSASFAVLFMSEYHAGLPRGGAAADFLSTAGRGWEHVSESGIPEAIPHLIEEAELSRHRVPVDVGRYDIVFNAEAMAALVDETLGAATELDRALGYEANASGTSYLDDPLAMLGQQRVASSNVTVTGNRSVPAGAATVRWDDEGVVPGEFTLVADGMLVDYQTTREQAEWLAPYYQQHGLPVRSHGCAAAGSALDITMQHAPNLALRPGRSAMTFEELVANTEKGIAMFDINPSMDQQQLNGIGRGTMREIVHGKLGRFVYGGALAFRSPELWKNVVGIGGPGTERLFGRSRGKGQPAQQTVHSVSAVPAKIPQLSIIDLTKKA